MEYILIDRRSRPGRNGVEMWRLTWWRIQDDTTWEMTVDASYSNFRKSGWDHVVHDECPWGVYLDLITTGRTTREGAGVVTADSAARILVRLDSQDQALELATASRLHNTHHGQYHDLFRTT
jgi:hypothetical protein